MEENSEGQQMVTFQTRLHILPAQHFGLICFKVQWDSGGHSNLPPGGPEDTVAVIRPHPQTRFPGPAGNRKWNGSSAPRDCHTRAAAGPTVRVPKSSQTNTKGTYLLTYLFIYFVI